MVNKFNTKKYINYSSILLVVFTFMIFYWGYLAPLNTLAVANAKVVVSGQNKQVQHLEGGIVKEILVKDGTKVKKEDILIRLDDTQIKSQYKILRNDLLSEFTKRDRLVAQRDSLEKIEYSEELKEFDKKNLESNKKLQNLIFNSNKELIDSQEKILHTKNKRLKEQIVGVRWSIKNKNLYLDSLNEEIDELERLYKEKYTDKLKLRDIRRKKLLIQNEISDLISKKASTEISILENNEEILRTQKEFINSVLENLKESSSKLKNLSEQVFALKDKINKTSIKAPIDGVIDNLQVFNNNSVLTSGQTIMNIVPLENKLIIQAMLNIRDIDTVKVGQEANITFSAFDTKMTFSIDGYVKYISADRKIDKNTNEPYYQVDIEVTKNGQKQILKNNFDLKVGMGTDVMIKTGSRTMLSYIIKPILDMKIRAFNEE
jgi:epimerase transport system membrane fusion protein